MADLRHIDLVQWGRPGLIESKLQAIITQSNLKMPVASVLDTAPKGNMVYIITKKGSGQKKVHLFIPNCNVLIINIKNYEYVLKSK